MFLQEREVAPIIADYWERAEFPHELVPKLAKLNLGGATLKGNGCPGQSLVGAAMAVIEIARVDGSLSTFLMVWTSHVCWGPGTAPTSANFACLK